MRSKVAIVLTMVGLLIGCASRPETRIAVDDRESERAIAELTKRTDADSLAAAGLLSLTKHRDQSVGFFVRAVAAQPRRADLVWLEARACQQTPPCDSRSMEHRLQVLDPTNGAGWLDALARADSQGDIEAKQSALAAIGRSERVDVYWTSLVAALSRAVASTRIMPLGDAEMSVIGILAAEGLPSYRVIGDTCMGKPLRPVQATETCRGIAEALERGDTYITEMLGTSIALRVWPKQSAQWQAANNARRTFEYRSKLLTKLEDHWPNARAAQSYLALCAQNRREQDVSRSQLIQAGLRPDPPAE